MNSKLLWKLAVALPFTFAVVVGFTDSKHVFAQLTPDDTLGGENSIVTPQDLQILIEGGALRGDNLDALFHSFEEFNVNSGQQVFFANPASVLNIFTRVTGFSSSNINGVLGVNGAANLFLLNPNGITFGANANLQLNGSFFATTADGFGFDNFTFSASGEEAPPPLLTISVPNFLDFRNNAGNIAVNGSNLSVNQGQDLSLAGGNVSLDNASLSADQGTIQIVGLSGNGRANLGDSFPGNEFTLSFIETGIFNSGLVTINASEVNTDNDDVFTEFLGGIYLDAVEEIRLINKSTLSSNGNSGIINLGSRITPDSITINNSQITAQENTGLGFAGTIFLNATDVILRNGSTVSADGDSGEDRDFGRIFIGDLGFTETVIINNSTLSTNSIEAAQAFGVDIFPAGVITIDASEQISLTNSTLSSNGNVGTIDLGFNFTPDTITINNSQITAEENTGVGFAGTILLNATDVILRNGSTVSADGDSGSIFIGNLGLTETVTINNSTLSTNSIEAAQNSPQFQIFAGNITIDTSSEISLTNSTLSSNGNFGIIRLGSNITPNTITFNNSTVVTNSTETAQALGVDFIEAGVITIDASQGISLTNSTLSSNGNFGIIDVGLIVNPNTITINNSQIIAQENTGVGVAGNIFLNATDVILSNGSILNADGVIGRIFIGDLSFTETVTINDSTLSTNSTETAQAFSVDNLNAGSITIDASEEISLTNSTLSSEGDSGLIAIGSVFADSPETVTIGASTISTNNNLSESNLITNVDEDRLEEGTVVNPNITGGSFEGFAGAIYVDAQDSILIENGSEITSDGSIGSILLGTITFESPRTVTINNSDLTTNNDLTGTQAGSININASESLDIVNDSTISANTPENSTGTGGNIIIDPERVTIQDSTISVNSQGSGPAGTITLDADNLTLDNGQITATTNNSDGGNITLRITDLLLLVNGSNISTNAGQSGGEGTGGDIDISARFVVATPTEDNDISANAVLDDAGNVTIRNTEIIFGIQPRDEDTGLSDITATSEVGTSGEISIDNQQATDPSQGLIELPEEVADESTFVAGGVCSLGEGSQFIVRGRGGTPDIPGFITRNDVINIDLVDEVLLPAPPPEAIKPRHRTDVTFIDSEGKEFKPAMGAVLLPNGMVEFVDYNPAEVYRDMYASAGCNRLSNE